MGAEETEVEEEKGKEKAVAERTSERTSEEEGSRLLAVLASIGAKMGNAPMVLLAGTSMWTPVGDSGKEIAGGETLATTSTTIPSPSIP